MKSLENPGISKKDRPGSTLKTRFFGHFFLKNPKISIFYQKLVIFGHFCPFLSKNTESARTSAPKYSLLKVPIFLHTLGPRAKMPCKSSSGGFFGYFSIPRSDLGFLNLIFGPFFHQNCLFLPFSWLLKIRAQK